MEKGLFFSRKEKNFSENSKKPCRKPEQPIYWKYLKKKRRRGMGIRCRKEEEP